MKTFGPRLRPINTRKVAPFAIPKVSLPFYSSPAWRSLLNAIIRERGYRCQRCGAGGRIYGDHITELSDGGAPLDARNVELLCAKCHGLKTHAERKRRAQLKEH